MFCKMESSKSEPGRVPFMERRVQAQMRTETILGNMSDH